MLRIGGDGICQISTPLSSMCKSNILGSVRGYIYFLPEVLGRKSFQLCFSVPAVQ